MKRLKIVSVVGARPQFIKAAALSHVIRQKHSEYLLHTGQHYSKDMSDVFFSELGISEPDANLKAGSGSHAEQTGTILIGIEKILMEQRPDATLVYGDTNSTLAGALAASKLNIPVVHVEAGLRSFNRRMPEEINRVITDHISKVLFCPTKTAVENLKSEGLTEGVHLTGDLMLDILKFSLEKNSGVKSKNLPAEPYGLVTIHRAENTDNLRKLKLIFDELKMIPLTLIFPIHPRTRKRLDEGNLRPPPNLQFVSPLSYMEMVAFEAHSKAIFTDSGGVQKEAYWLSIPCFTIRDETEWVETVQSGWNRIVGGNTSGLAEAFKNFVAPSQKFDILNAPAVAQDIVDQMEKSLA